MADSEERETQRLRAAGNQSLVRDVNDRIYDLAGHAASAEYVCECAVRSCAEHIVLSPDEYVEIRRHAMQFVVRPGHWAPSSEQLVPETDRYYVIEKTGQSGVLAERSARPHRHES